MSENMQLKFGPMVTPEQASKLMIILKDLLVCVQGQQPSYIHEDTMTRAAHCIANLPSTPLSERECIQKITRILSSHEDGDVVSYFTIHYNKLVLLKLNPQHRHSLVEFLLFLAEKHMQEPESEPEPEPAPASGGSNSGSGSCSGDYLSQVLASSRSNSSSSRCYSLQSNLSNMNLNVNSNSNSNSPRSNHSNINPNIKRNSSPYQNGNGFSYDASQSGKGLSREPLPNYVEILNSKGEPDLTQNLVLNSINSFIGIQGKYLKKDVVSGCFKLDPINTETLTHEQAGMLLRLSELGNYHDRVAKFADVTTGYNPMGIMGQALITKLRQELMDFRGQVAFLADTVKGYRDPSKSLPPEAEGDDLTLLGLLVWYLKPLHRMQWLTKIANKCQMLKGGELASTLYDMLDNGNPMVNDLVRDLLNAVCVPLGGMISRWMLEGGIIDLYGEFFVEVLNDVGPDRLWHDKFRLRLPMLPKFVQLELANKILKTGKSINFLREVCEMQDLGKNRDEIKEIMDHNTDQIYAYVQDTHWHAAVETCYMQTSKHVLDIMVGPHKLLSHLYGMRRYLLLGQGDFVSILIEHMKDELERKGTDIYAHDLSAMLDAALRCENAHHEDPEILNHLDVVLQAPFPGDCGWDIISLQYTVHGPLATMLEPTMPIYKAIFKPLWRMKHIEFVLSMKIWNVQMSNAKKLGLLRSEIGSTSHRLHLFTSEIMHFIHQMQYYILFEVIECNWVELQKKFRAANTLDEILDAHEKFLNDITVGCFHGQPTQKQQYLESVYDNIITLEAWQARYYSNCYKELEARQKMAEMVAESEKQGKFGVTTEQKLQRDQECKLFEQCVIMARRSLEDIASEYEKAVSSFLMTLNSNQDPNLQLFGTRLDFNEYYKKRDTNLSKPLTFEHMRLSNVFVMNSSRFTAHAASSKE